MSNTTNTTPKVYVSTYAKYSSGSLEGKWIDLDQFDSANDFIKHCCGLFNDETSPELMFQDWENVPDFLTNESASEKELERLFKYLSFEEGERSIIVAYIDATGNSDVDFQDVFDNYCGTARSEAEFAEDYANENYKLPEYIVIDWEETWNQYLQYDFYVGEDEYGEKHFFYQS